MHNVHINYNSSPWKNRARPMMSLCNDITGHSAGDSGNIDCMYETWVIMPGTVTDCQPTFTFRGLNLVLDKEY